MAKLTTRTSRWMPWLLGAALLALAPACGDEAIEPADDGAGPSSEELAKLEAEAPIGDTNEPGSYKGDDFDHNGEPDFSELCKPIPDVEALADPVVTISLDGLTLRLRDRAGDYDRTFPIGVGRIGNSGASLTPTSGDRTWYLRGDAPAIVDGATSSQRKWAWNYSCRIWSGSTYYNPLTGRNEYRSYFAGLPFIRVEGPSRAVYGIHGPITNYWRESGGELKRGFVSGGCIRMEAEDVLELFARIRGHRTPVTIREEIERDEEGLSVDADRFVGAECEVDTDCADPDATCVANPLSEKSYCTMPCERSVDCPTRPFGVESYCVSNPLSDDPTQGTCAVASSGHYNRGCERYGQLEARSVPPVDDPSQRVSVCLPTGDAWIGHACSIDAACATGQCLSAEGVGICSQPCTAYCPDRAGEPMTRCVASFDGSEGGSCVSTCESDEDCAAGSVCREESFFGRSGSDMVCVPG